jgi:hypothetical protein
VLAALFDLALSLIGRSVMPWNRGGSVRRAGKAHIEVLPADGGLEVT